MNTTVYTRAFLLVGHCAERGIRARRAVCAFPRVLELNIITSKKQRERRLLRSADPSHVSRVTRIWWSSNQRRPRRIGSRVCIAVFVRTTNRRYWSPQAVVKLAGKRGLQCVVKGEVSECKQACFFDRRH